MTRKLASEEEIERAIKADDEPLKEFWVNKYKDEASKSWDIFYKMNSTRFFKDRHWTEREFSELLQGKKVVLEIGCGVGNFAFPMLQKNSDLFIYCCDFSKRAIEHVKSNSLYGTLNRCEAFVADVTTNDLRSLVRASDAKEGVDVVTMIFVLSAVPPEKMESAIKNIHQTLKNGGVVLFRDYARTDMAQYRFAQSRNSKLDDNLYVRRDRTLAYFFELDEVRELFQNNGFRIDFAEVVKRSVENKAKEIQMDRIFIQGRFIKH